LRAVRVARDRRRERDLPKRARCRTLCSAEMSSGGGARRRAPRSFSCRRRPPDCLARVARPPGPPQANTRDANRRERILASTSTPAGNRCRDSGLKIRRDLRSRRRSTQAPFSETPCSVAITVPPQSRDHGAFSVPASCLVHFHRSRPWGLRDRRSGGSRGVTTASIT